VKVDGKARMKAYLRHVCEHIRLMQRDGALYFILAALLLLPVWFQPRMTLDSVVQDTMFVIDISESMNVPDVDFPRPQTSRLELAKAAVRAGMASLPCGSRVSIALFAGDEVVMLFEPLEICRHFPAIEQVVTRLDTRMRWIGDSWIIRAVAASIREAQKRNLNVVLVSDGDEMPHRVSPRFADLVEYKGKIKGVLWGVGGEAPQPVPKLDGSGQVVAYWTPEEAVLEGNHPNLLAMIKDLRPGEQAPAEVMAEVGEHLSAFNRPLLRGAAESAGLEMQHLATTADAVASLQNPDYRRQAPAERDARWIFGLAAGCLALLGWFRSSLAGLLPAITAWRSIMQVRLPKFRS